MTFNDFNSINPMDGSQFSTPWTFTTHLTTPSSLKYSPLGSQDAALSLSLGPPHSWLLPHLLWQLLLITHSPGQHSTSGLQCPIPGPCFLPPSPMPSSTPRSKILPVPISCLGLSQAPQTPTYNCLFHISMEICTRHLILRYVQNQIPQHTLKAASPTGFPISVNGNSILVAAVQARTHEPSVTPLLYCISHPSANALK